MFDVIISGAGPAGSTAARLLAKNGYKVLLLDKASFPRPKLCGGGVTHLVYKYLDIDISSVIIDKSKQVRFDYIDEKGSLIKFNKLFVDMVDRSKFDNLLLEEAIKAGVEFRKKILVKNFTEKPDEIIVHTSSGDIHAKYLIGADGATSSIAKKLGFNLKKSNLILEATLPYKEFIDPKEKTFMRYNFGLIKKGYGWVFPKKNYASIGLGGTNKNPLLIKDAFLKFIDMNKDLLETKNLNIQGVLAPVYENYSPKRATDRVILIGDAAFLMNPLTGEGISNAIWSAKIAADFFIKNNIKENHNFSLKFLHNEIFKHIGTELETYKKLARNFYFFPHFWYKFILKNNIMRIKKFLASITF